MKKSTHSGFGIAAGHEVTLTAAKDILTNGGNAVDASIAALLCSMVAEPCMSGPGGGGIAVIKEPGRDGITIDFFCQTPKVKLAREEEGFTPIVVDFGNTQETFYTGGGSVAVPGSIAGVFALHQMKGSIPIIELFDYAAVVANQGVKVDRFQAYDIDLLKNILASSPTGYKYFYPDGKLVKEGGTLCFPAMGDLFEVLAREGKRLFYEGEIAKQIDTLSRYTGGHIRMADLLDYQVGIRKCLNFPYKDWTINAAGFPSKGSGILALVLHLLRNKKIGQPFSYTHFLRIAESILEVKSIQPNNTKLQSRILSNYGIHFPISSAEKPGGTTHFSIVDQAGLSVSVTTSLGEGSGLWVDSGDIHLNNMLGEEALLPDGFYNWPEDTRLMTMMTPVIASFGVRKIITGSGGAGRIPYMIAQLLDYMVTYDFDLAKATEAPRIFYQSERYEAELGFESRKFSPLNEWNEPSLYFGGLNSIHWDGESSSAFADQRRFGSAFP